MTLHLGDCLEVLRTLGDASVDAVVTDPPYGLSDHRADEVAACLLAWLSGEAYQPKGKGFMGKAWDAWVPGPEVWREALRVLKPGGHILAFAGTRSMDLMSMAIRLAGFELRDSIGWANDGGGAPLVAYVYGSGFPKSLDVSKAIDKRGGNAHLIAEIGAALKAARKARGIGVTEADRTYCGGVTLWSWYEGRPAGQQMPTSEVMCKIARDWPELQRYADAIEEAERDVVGRQSGNLLAVAPGQGNDRSATTLDITAPATPEAQQWAGWGTALKPAWEPVILARKPLEGTVAANVLQWGTGGLNVDGCRVGTGGDKGVWPVTGRPADRGSMAEPMGAAETDQTSGRWPANLILTYPEDEYRLRDNITPQQLAKLAEWMNENA